MYIYVHKLNKLIRYLQKVSSMSKKLLWDFTEIMLKSF